MSQVIDQTEQVVGDVPLLRNGFSVQVDRAEGPPVVRLHGELDMATAPRLGRALHAALDTTPTRLDVDLSKLTFVDSTGIRVLFDAGRRARADGCTLVLCSPCRSVRKALRLTRIDLLVAIDEGLLSAPAQPPRPA